MFGSKSHQAGLAPTDRRLEPRQAINRRGVIVSPMLEMACVIMDMSTNGTRVRLDRGSALPSSIVIIDVVEGIAYDASVMWQKSQEAGLKKTNSQSLRGLVTGRMTAARDAWLRAGGGR